MILSIVVVHLFMHLSTCEAHQLTDYTLLNRYKKKTKITEWNFCLSLSVNPEAK